MFLLKVAPFLALFVAACSFSILPKNHALKDIGDPVGVPCTKNTSNAWLDIVIAIDISTNMGTNNVRQITLNLASELQKYPIGQSGPGGRYTRVALITYASTATVVADFTNFTSPQQFANAVVGIKGSTTDNGADMTDAVIQAYNLIYSGQPCDQPVGCQTLARPSTFVLFAASANGDTSGVIPNAQNILTYSTIITYNYNPSDNNLAYILTTISSPTYNFMSPYKTTDLDWALTQSNCVCPWWEGQQLVVVEPSTGRLTRYAECFNIWDLIMGPTNLNDTNICGDSTQGYPAAINAKATSDFIKQFIHDEIPNKFYIGLHRQGLQPNGNWVWYTFLGNDMAMGNFTDWAPGYDPNTPQNCALEYRLPGSTLQNETIGWIPASCELFDTGVTECICSMKACTTDYMCPTQFQYKERKAGQTGPWMFNEKNLPKIKFQPYKKGYNVE